MSGLGALKHLRFLTVGVNLCKFYAGVRPRVTQTINQGFGVLNIYDFRPWELIYADFIQGLDLELHLQNTIVDIYEVSRVRRAYYNYSHCNHTSKYIRHMNHHIQRVHNETPSKMPEVIEVSENVDGKSTGRSQPILQDQ